MAVHVEKCTKNPEVIVECEYSIAGCKEKVKRKDMKSHLESNALIHAEMNWKLAKTHYIQNASIMKALNEF